jgi:Uma2 family endonuclease
MVVLIAENSLPKLTATPLTLEEYRKIEATAEERHEYRDGEIVTMPGGSLNHSRIAVDITTFLNLALRDTNF